ncbi:MAG: molecular chaperone HtpG [Alphaproteobacteria bacterium]|nr:molecular chaperone HtpG [Alphaproteobacteria bacterium]
MNATNKTTSGSHSFQAEVAQLLHLMVHSIYSETDIFLRELISNGSDACDKLRYEALDKPDLIAEGSDLKIIIQSDKDAGTLTIADNGIGMTEQEMTENLGTIARSGTRAFMDRIKQAQEAKESKEGGQLIGQFGVGFYAAFMVADKIEVISRKAGSTEAHIWTSTGGDGFTVEPADDTRAKAITHGTDIILHLKSDALKYLEEEEIERIVGRYSDHIQFPIMLQVDADTSRQINKASALWQRSKSELTAEDYKEAYRTICNAYDEPALTLHYKAEGRQSYAVMLFVPTMRPFDLYDPNYKSGLKLYVRRVFISENASLLPNYLRFVSGIVDSEDLPLNISREMLQNNVQLAQIRKAITSRVISELAKTAENDAEQFLKIWEAFGATIKEGLYEDRERKDELLPLIRFTTTQGETLRSLKDYVADLKENQTEIYYLVGESIARLKANPKLEAAKARGVEVLLLTDHVDAFWTSAMMDFEGKKLTSLSQGNVDLSLIPLLEAEADKANDETSGKDVEEATLASLKVILKDLVSDVRASSRLTDSAACLVAEGFGFDRELERLLARQNKGSGAKPVLEVNLRHPLLKAAAKAKREDQEDIAFILLDQSKIIDGEVPEDPAAFASRLNRLILRGIA